MIQERLLERISRLEETTGGPDANIVVNRHVESIISHLLRLLNTRQGSVPIAEDYGVPDMTNVPGESIIEARQHIEGVIQKVVRKYEPRLANVKLIMQQEKDEAFSLKFRLEAHLAEHNDVPVIFETVVSTDGKVNIS